MMITLSVRQLGSFPDTVIWERSQEEQGHVHDKQVLEGVIQYGWRKLEVLGRNGRH